MIATREALQNSRSPSKGRSRLVAAGQTQWINDRSHLYRSLQAAIRAPADRIGPVLLHQLKLVIFITSSNELLLRSDAGCQLPASGASLAATSSRCASASRMCSDDRYRYQRFNLTHNVAASV